tara:strand:- start:418 stop:606 length:189 start_codon:yes stop_codon:yes gene_type:complete
MNKGVKYMNVYHIVYSIKKEQCCPPSSYREINEATVMAESEVLAVAKLTGDEIEIKSIKLEN